MKNFSLFFIFFIGLQNLNAQLSISHTPIVDITNSNVFLDASKIFSSAAGAVNNVGKGIVIPSVDLINFEFNSNFISSTDSPSFYDGMLVYNSATGNTLTTGTRSTTTTLVTPGFYYFFNPNGAVVENVTSGVWKPVGSDSLKNIGTTEIATSTSIDGAQVYAIKGEFTTLGINALVSVVKPAGMTGYYKMTTYIGGKTFRSDISEFKMNPTVLNTDNVVTGNGLFSEVYPAGTYSYTLEYFK